MSTRASAAVTPVVLPSKWQHIGNRFSFGVNESLAANIRSAGSAEAWLRSQFNWGKITDTRSGAVISWYPRLKDTPSAAWARVKSDERSSWDYGFDFACYSMARKILSRRQVHEVMVDFWSNLLYIPMGEDRSFPWRYSYDTVIRSRALSTYRNLLRGTIVHPAMSGWLNNSSNTKSGINENLGRELLELYTVGRPSGYDEADVKNSARLLTGFSVRVFDDFAAFYSKANHYRGRVRILGFTHANSSSDGRPAVNAYLDYLARHPATAKRIARRLCVRFVSDTPSSSLVSAVAKTYLASDTDIRATLWTLVKHPEFVAAQRKKVRTPIEDVVNSARVLGMAPTGSSDAESFAQKVIWMCNNMGQNPYTWPRPDGFPETSSTWTSPARVLRSWDMHYNLAGNWWGSREVAIPARVDQLPTQWPCTLGQLVDHQSRMLLGRTASLQLRAAVASALNLPETYVVTSAAKVTEWGWVVIRGAVLNTPEGMLR